jgi:hypothetical protein
MPVATKTITIPAGQSLSNSADCQGATQILIGMPAAWDNANLTLQFSGDGTNFYDLFTYDGYEATMVLTRGAMVPLINLDVASKGMLKIRSGTRSFPVAQTVTRDFLLTIVT